MRKRMNFFIRFLTGIDFLLPPAFYMYITHAGLVPPGIDYISGPGYLFAFGFLLIAAAMIALYENETFIRAKILAAIGNILVVVGLLWGVETVIDYATKNKLAYVAVPPFYHPPAPYHSGMITFTSRIGAILVVLSVVMVFPLLIYRNVDQARNVTLMLSHISIPMLITLAGAVVAHPLILSTKSIRFERVLEALISLPIFSLILIDVYLVLESIEITE